jgi:transposase
MVQPRRRGTDFMNAGLIETDPLWTALGQTFRSVNGVADKTVALLLAELREIGTL